MDIAPSDVDLEFIEALLEPEDAAYPWNLADESTDAYFHNLELQFGLPDFSDAELITSSENFYQNLDIIWDQVAAIENHNISKNTVNYLQEVLHNAFSVIPEVMINPLYLKLSKV